MKKRKKKSATKSATKSKATKPQPRTGSSKGKKGTAAKGKPGKPVAKIKKTAFMAAGATDGIPSLPRLRQILGEYYQPVVDYLPIGDSVPFGTLTRRINEEWKLTGDRQFQDGEINAKTVVKTLSEAIDFRATH